MTTKAIEAGARTDLLPCPFCGGEPDIRTRQDEDIWTHNIVTWTSVHCAECGISFDWPPGAEPTAVEQWNTRAIPSGELVPASAVAEMRERCAAKMDERAAYFERAKGHRDWNDAAKVIAPAQMNSANSTQPQRVGITLWCRDRF